MSVTREVRSNASVQLRLFCFHHAGGSAAAFNSWAAAFPSGITVERVQLPGRVPGRGEPHTRMTTLLPWVYERLEPLLDRPFAFYGQSLGALVAFELARAIRKSGGRRPSALFVASRRAPQCPLTRTPLCSLPDAELIIELRAMGGLIDTLAGSSKWMEYFLPVLRADLTISDLYQYEPGAPLECDVMAFRGAADPIVSDAEINAWSAQTNGAFMAETLPGRHFFSAETSARLRRRILQRLGLAPDQANSAQLPGSAAESAASL